MIILYTLLAYLCGSMMFSYWISIAMNKNLKVIGDGNPGAYNLWEAAGVKAGIAGGFLDFMKGYIPVAILVRYGFIQEWEIVLVTIAPILGHVFSPFMKFKGGKGIAVTFGVWSGATDFRLSLAYGIILALLSIIQRLIKINKDLSNEVDGFVVVIGMALLGIFLALTSWFPDYFIILSVLNLLILAYSNKTKLYTLYKERNFIRNIK